MTAGWVRPLTGGGVVKETISKAVMVQKQREAAGTVNVESGIAQAVRRRRCKGKGFVYTIMLSGK